MQRVIQRVQQVDWEGLRRDGHVIFTKLIRTKDPKDTEGQEITVPGRHRLSRCLTTMDLTSLGVGSCAGTGMYLVSGMVAKRFAGPGVIFSFFIAAVASVFSGACYAEFGVRVPNTTGSAYTYSYVSVGEFLAFVIGWNMVLEYLIGTSACARALSACIDSLFEGAVSRKLTSIFGTIYGKPPDLLAFSITIGMTMVLVAGVKKSLLFNNVLNGINFCVWVFIVGAGLFYVNLDNWTQHHGFLPFGWSGVFSGAATCFYAFIGFDIIATTGEEANNPKRSIPLAIVFSLGIILVAYVSCSTILTLIVPYDEVDTESALVEMFGYAGAPVCKFIVAIGALAGLSVSMFGSMFPMPRIIYAMASDGLLFKPLAAVSEATGTPALATVGGGACAAVVALFVQLEVLVEMMSIGTLLAYTLVSVCVFVLRYQPHFTNLIELLPQSLRTPVDPEPGPSGTMETSFARNATHALPQSQRVMVRRVTRSSPDSDDTLPGGDDSDEFGRDDSFLVNTNSENKFYGAVPGGSGGSSTACGRFWDAIYRKLHSMSYLCPGLFPWVDLGPATEFSGLYVIKAVGAIFVLIVMFDMCATYGSPGETTFTGVLMTLMLLTILLILLLISRRPQNRVGLMYATPGLPFVPAIAMLVNVYLMLNLSALTLVRFTIWMLLGLVVYFKYSIKNSKLESPPTPPPVETPPPRNPMDCIMIQPASSNQNKPKGDRNIFEGDGSKGPYGYPESLLTWHDTELQAPGSSSGYKNVESRYNARTNSTSTHATSHPARPAQPAQPAKSRRPPWAYPDAHYDNWDD